MYGTNKHTQKHETGNKINKDKELCEACDQSNPKQWQFVSNSLNGDNNLGINSYQSLQIHTKKVQKYRLHYLKVKQEEKKH